MRFIQEYGFTVKIGQEQAHQRWLIENHDRLLRSQPKGTRYIGTFVVVLSSEKNAGSYRALYEIDSYAAMDAQAAMGKDPDSESSKLTADWSAFWDVDLAAPWSNTLMKDVNDATVFDPKTEAARLTPRCHRRRPRREFWHDRHEATHAAWVERALRLR